MAWESYIAPFEEFCARYLIQSVGEHANKPLHLEDWQLEFLEEALTVDQAKGHPRWRSAVWVLPRKNGKTTSLASYALFHLLTRSDSPEVLLAAASDRQAGRLFDSIVAFVRKNPELDDLLVLRQHIGEIARKDGAGRIIRVASSPDTLHGYNPSLVIADELAQWNKPSLRKAWAALTTGGGARPFSQVFSISTAGEAEERDQSILGRLIDANEEAGAVERRHPALTISRNEEGGVLVYNYSAPTSSSEDMEAIKLANPASWITEDYLKRQRANPELDEGTFLQLHGCVWATGTNAYVDAHEWRALGGGLAISDGRQVCLGLDGSRTYDTTVVSWASLGEDGRIDVDCRVFSVRKEAPHHVLHGGGIIDLDDVEAFVLELFGRYDVWSAAFDPRFLGRSAEILEKRLPDARLVEVYPGSTADLDGTSALYRLVKDGSIRHRNDPVLNAHVLNAVADWTDKGPRLRKRATRKPIDAAVATALAVNEVVARKPAKVWAAAW